MSLASFELAKSQESQNNTLPRVPATAALQCLSSFGSFKRLTRIVDGVDCRGSCDRRWGGVGGGHILWEAVTRIQPGACNQCGALRMPRLEAVARTT